ncbi:tail fiber assembly chaperone [Enterobacter phage vB_EcRAM-01]|nr:tail fiber assembly chaperone [Enterobacter phage vB_EcRAM-01]
MTEQNQTQQLQNDVLLLKARVFDLNEIIQGKEQELANHRQLVGQICGLLEIDGSQGVSPDALIGAIKALLPTTAETAGDDEAIDRSKA